MKPFAVRCGILACVLVCSASGAAAAQTTTPLDEIILRDGTYLRATIVERSATRLVVMLPTGEVREYPASEVVSAGATQQAPIIVQPVMPAAPTAQLHVWSDAPELSLQRMTGSVSVPVMVGSNPGLARVDQYAIVCNAPCDTDLPVGTYQLGIARGAGQAVRAGRPIDLGPGSVDLRLDYTNNEPLRIAGWLTWIGGAALGAGLVVGSLFTGPEHCSSFGRCFNDVNVPLLIVGAVVVVLALAVGIPLAFAGDGASVTRRTGDSRLSASRRAASRWPLVF